MKFDVFLASAKDDEAMADLVVRRLKALKFKVRYDKRRTHTEPAPRDTRDINQARSVVVLWSEAACDKTNPESDWVHAMAHTARARADALVQIGLDATVPDEPFDADHRYQIAGMTTRTTPEDFYLFIESLAERAGRTDLRDWLMIPAKDKAAQEAWRQAHPNDPLAKKGEPVGKKKADASAPPKPAKAAQASEAAPRPARPAPRAAAAVAAAPVRAASPAAVSRSDEDTTGNATLWFLLAGVAVMFLLAYAFRTLQATTPAMPAISNALLCGECPPGTMPRAAFETLEPGPIINDTEETETPPDDEN